MTYNKSQEQIATIAYASSQLAGLQEDLANVGLTCGDEDLQRMVVKINHHLLKGQAEITKALGRSSELALLELAENS
jgi:hypothetical protein